METAVWVITALLMVAGLLGSVLPVLPGATLIFAAAVLNRVLLGAEQSVGWWTIAVLGILMLASFAVDLLAGAAGARWFGASRYGAVGGLLGTVAGLAFLPFGLIVGPLAGAVLGEIIGGKRLAEAGRSGTGAVVGTIGATLAKASLALSMILLFAVMATR